jgi:hypothetical protein
LLPFFCGIRTPEPITKELQSLAIGGNKLNRERSFDHLRNATTY